MGTTHTLHTQTNTSCFVLRGRSLSWKLQRHSLVSSRLVPPRHKHDNAFSLPLYLLQRHPVTSETHLRKEFLMVPLHSNSGRDTYHCHLFFCRCRAHHHLCRPWKRKRKGARSTRGCSWIFWRECTIIVNPNAAFLQSDHVEAVPSSHIWARLLVGSHYGWSNY